MVVTNQPTVPVTTVVRPAGDYYLTLSIVLTVICLFCGTWYSLFCTIPAIVIATSVSMINVYYFHFHFFCRLVMLQPVVILKELGQKVVLLLFWILLLVSGGWLFLLLSLHPLLGLLQVAQVAIIAAAAIATIHIVEAIIIATNEETRVCF